jgi:general secretion pathway protein H
VTKQIGFSLIELLLVLIIIVGVISLAAPRFNNVFAGLKLKQQVRTMLISLQTTRNQAISKGQQAEWLIDLENHYYQFGVDNKRQYYPSDINVTVTSTANLQRSDAVLSFQFFPDGSSSGGEIALKNNSASFAIQLNWLTGEIKLYE